MELDGLIGRRVSLRQHVGERAGRPLYSDAVGELTKIDDVLTVRTRRGPVAVHVPAVVAVRAIPPAAPRRAPLAAIVALEGLCADAWPAQVDEPLGGWRLRAAGGYTGRANSALAIGSPGTPLPAALDAVRAYAERAGIGPRVHVPVGSPWDRAVAAAGWVLDAGHEKGAEVSVQVAELAALAGPGVRQEGGHADVERQDGHLPDVELPERPDPAWWELATGGEPSPAQRHVLDPGGTPRTAFAMVRAADGRPAGQLRATVVADHLHLSMIEVVPAARRAGLATALVLAAAAWGRPHGARWAVLQVALHNTGAIALYERLGFTEHHQYRYLVPPDGRRATPAPPAPPA